VRASGGGGSNAAPIGQTISLRKSGGDRRYVERTNSNTLLARARGTGNSRQRFRVESHPNGGVALRSLSNNKYLKVTVNNAVVATGGAKRARERFVWQSRGNGQVALRHVSTGRWLQAPHRTANARVVSVARSNPAAWETFNWRRIGSKLLTSDSTTGDSPILYPNPASNFVTISGAEEGAVVRINNILGQELIVKTVASNEETIELNGLDEGIYLVTVNGKSISNLVVR